MNGNCHFIFGASVGTMLAMNMDKISQALPHLTNSSETATLFVLGGLLGGIMPDIDNPVSYVGKLTVPVSTVIGKTGELFGKSGAMHRGILHDPITYLAGLAISYLYCPSLCGFFIGCLTHLFLDLFNPAGIPFLFGVKHLRLGKIKSGSNLSIILTWVLVVLAVLTGFLCKFCL